MKYSVGMTVSVFGEPIRSSDPYKQCLDWSVGAILVLSLEQRRDISEASGQGGLPCEGESNLSSSSKVQELY